MSVKKNAVLFRPYASIKNINWVERELLQLLLSKKYQVTVISCGGILGQFCHNMYLHGLNFNSSTPDKRKVCSQCSNGKDFLNLSFSGKINVMELEQIESKYNPEIYKLVDHAFTLTNPEFELDGTNFCSIAAHEIRLTHKLGSIIPEDLRSAWKHQTLMSLMVYIKTKYFFEKCKEEFSLATTYNGNYSLNNSFLRAAKFSGVDAISFQVNAPPHKPDSRIEFRSHNFSIQETFISDEWDRYRSVSLTLFQMFRIYFILLSYFKSIGDTVFSREISKRGLNRVSQILNGANSPFVLLTLSSSDEIFALNDAGYNLTWKTPQAFLDDQLKAVYKIGELAKIFPAIVFVIRPHPREFGAKSLHNRTISMAPGLSLILKACSNLPNNVFVDEPSSEISLYDWLNFKPIVFNLNSSAGVENLALSGITIDISNGRQFSYPKELNYQSTKIQYLEFIRTLNILNEKEDRQKTIMAWRWLYFKYYRRTISIRRSKISKIFYYKMEARFKTVESNKEDIKKRKLNGLFNALNHLYFPFIKFKYRKLFQDKSSLKDNSTKLNIIPFIYYKIVSLIEYHAIFVFLKFLLR